MANKNWVKIVALVVMTILVLMGCSKISGGSVKENPASDFSYGLTDDSQGIVITSYTGLNGNGSGRKNVVIPATIENLPVLEIGDNTFAPKVNADIKEIVLPNTIRKIGRSAFSGTAITSFNMPDSVTEIGSGAFMLCKSLTEVHLSDNIEFLPSLFGWDSSSLKKLNLPKNIKFIDRETFIRLKELTELTIPDSLTVEFVTYNGNNTWRYLLPTDENTAFKGCSKLPLATRQRLKDLGYTGEF